MAAIQGFSTTHPGDPEPGDLIEIFRPAYQHWALYLGDGYVINVTPVGKYAQPSRVQRGPEGNPGVLSPSTTQVVDPLCVDSLSRSQPENPSEVLEGPDRACLAHPTPAFPR